MLTAAACRCTRRTLRSTVSSRATNASRSIRHWNSKQPPPTRGSGNSSGSVQSSSISIRGGSSSSSSNNNSNAPLNPPAAAAVPKESVAVAAAAVAAAAVPKEAASAGYSSTTTSTVSSVDGGVPVLLSLLAAAAGVATVSAAAFVVERNTPVPPFDMDAAQGQRQRYDEGTYFGRCVRMLLQCDPALLLYTDEQVRAAQMRIQNFSFSNQPENNSVIGNNNNNIDHHHRALWEDKRLVESAVHPGTGEIVPRPFRMSGYVPYNGPICVAMVASTTTSALLFWSWVNQSQNALVNYYNRNTTTTTSSSTTTEGTEPDETSRANFGLVPLSESQQTLLQSYAIAVGSALTVAFGLAKLIQRSYPPAVAASLLRYVAFPSAVVASSLNCYIVRSPEIAAGIPLLDRHGQPVVGSSVTTDKAAAAAAGTAIETVPLVSHVAAATGVYTTTASRALLQAPVYFLPPVLLATVFRQYLQRMPRHTVPLTTYLLLVSFGMGLPATVALFPQTSSVDANLVEDRFRHLIDPETQQPYKLFYYNKGL